MTDDTGRPLRHAAHRAASRPPLVAYILRPYLSARGMDEASLGHELGVDAATIDRLALCRRPSGEADFRATVTAISAAVGVDPDRLANMLNAAEATVALGEKAASARAEGILAAARDRSRESTDPVQGSGAEDPNH